MPHPTDYWIILLDGAYAVRSAAGIELESIDCPADARAHILDLQHRDLIAAQEEQAALDDFEAQHFAEAA